MIFQSAESREQFLQAFSIYGTQMIIQEQFYRSRATWAVYSHWSEGITNSSQCDRVVVENYGETFLCFPTDVNDNNSGVPSLVKCWPFTSDLIVKNIILGQLWSLEHGQAEREHLFSTAQYQQITIIIMALAGFDPHINSCLYLSAKSLVCRSRVLCQNNVT